jgi:hypothetical protein
MHIIAAVTLVAMGLEAGQAAESVLTLIEDKNILLVPGIHRHDCAEIFRFALKGSQN